jgi:hypothetical protein
VTAKQHYLDDDEVEDTAMMVSTEPNLHSPLLGCYKIAPHFGSVEIQYPMYAIDRSSRGTDLLHTNEDELATLVAHFLFGPENGGGQKYCKYSYVLNYGLAVTVSSKEW